MKKLILVLVIFVAFAGVSFGQSMPLGKINVGGGLIFPLEKFSTAVKVGYSGTASYEKVVNGNVALLTTWNYSFDGGKQIVGNSTINQGQVDFKYYMNNIMKDTKIVPYLKFGAGAAAVDFGSDDIDPLVILGTATSIGINWKAFETVELWSELSALTAGTEATRIGLRFGIAVPLYGAK